MALHKTSAERSPESVVSFFEAFNQMLEDMLNHT